jgi:colicin import membrane protein
VRADWIISGSVHVAVLVAGLVSLASSHPATDLSNFVPVSIVTDTNLSRAALGEENAHAPAPTPHPLADKTGDPKHVKQLAPTAADKPEITTAAAPPPAPQPEPELKPQPKPVPRQAEKHEKQATQFKPDRIAELLKKTTPPQAREKPRQPAHRYDANQIAQLLDQRDPRRQVATGPVVSDTPSLGAPTAAPDAQLSQSEIDALRQRIRECWSPPPGIDANSNLYVKLRVLFKPDGSLAVPPVVVEGSPSPLGPALAESGKRALLLCQPFTMLKPEHYAQWKDIAVKFSPQELSGN